LRAVLMQKLMKIVDGLFVALMVCTYCVGVWVICFKGVGYWIDFITDDSYYYLGVARSVVDYGISAFLPPFSTNGYQPLWLLIIVITSKMFGTSDISLVLQVFSLSFFFVGIFCLLSKKIYGYAFPAIVCLLAFPDVGLSGMETSLVPMLVLTLFRKMVWWKKGGVGALLFLARLDALALVVFESLYEFMFKRGREIKSSLVLLLVVSAYFIVNYEIFGVFVPVSGLSKAVGNVVGENYSVVKSYWHGFSPILVISVLYCCIVLFFSNKPALHFKKELAVVMASLVLEVAYYSTLSGWPVWGWYMWPLAMLTYFLVLEIVLGIGSFAKHGHSVVVNGAALLFLFISVLYLCIPGFVRCGGIFLRLTDLGDRGYLTKNFELASYVKQKFPAGTFFAMGDRAGSFGFFLGNNYRFLHTEGLVASSDYYKYMKRDAGREFLESHKVQYLVAERDRFFMYGDYIGVAEPVQGLSSHIGPYLLCFSKKGIVLDQSYIGKNGFKNKRYLLDFKDEKECPQVIRDEFYSLRQKYGELRKFSLYSEY